MTLIIHPGLFTYNVKHIIISRSAALFYMCKFEECLGDITRAALNDYDEKLLYKLYLREARCLKYLGRDHLECYKKAVKVCYFLKAFIILWLFKFIIAFL
jgi:hypothetical protein